MALELTYPLPPPAAPRSSLAVGFANLLLAAGGVAFAGGLAGLLLGSRWTDPVALCGGGNSIGTQGAVPLWYACLLGLALAVVVIVVAAVFGVVSLIRHDDRAAGRAGLALLVGGLASVACFAGAIVVFGDSPVFCF